MYDIVRQCHNAAAKEHQQHCCAVLCVVYLEPLPLQHVTGTIYREAVKLMQDS